MRPLQAVGLGLLLIALEARFGEYDGLPDPIGWLLVLLGLRALTQRTAIGSRLALWYLGAAALAVSAVLWLPGPRAALEDADTALLWAVDVPALGFQALLCLELSRLARSAGERTAAGWFRLTAIGLVVGLALPVLYDAAGWAWLEGTGDLGLLLQLLVLVLSLWYSGRAWTGAEQRLPRSVRRATEAERRRRDAQG